MSLVERQSRHKLKIIRTDREGEFMSREFQEFSVQKGVKHELTALYTPQQNGIAERKNRTLVKKARSMLKASGLAKSFWADAISTSAYVSNISSTYAIKGKTSHEAQFGVKIKVSHLRVFGCVAFVHIPVQNLQKLDNRIVKGIFIRYCTDAKAYRIYVPKSAKVLVSIDIRFIESEIWQWTKEKETSSDIIALQEKRVVTVIGNSKTGEMDNSDLAIASSSERDSSLKQVEQASDSSVDKSPTPKVRTLKELYESCSFLNVIDPSSFEEAEKLEHQRQAMAEQIDSIQKNGT